MGNVKKKGLLYSGLIYKGLLRSVAGKLTILHIHGVEPEHVLLVGGFYLVKSLM